MLKWLQSGKDGILIAFPKQVSLRCEPLRFLDRFHVKQEQFSDLLPNTAMGLGYFPLQAVSMTGGRPQALIRLRGWGWRDPVKRIRLVPAQTATESSVGSSGSEALNNRGTEK
jgi:hypothetical protein